MNSSQMFNVPGAEEELYFSMYPGNTKYIEYKQIPRSAERFIFSGIAEIPVEISEAKFILHDLSIHEPLGDWIPYKMGEYTWDDIQASIE